MFAYRYWGQEVSRDIVNKNNGKGRLAELGSIFASIASDDPSPKEFKILTIQFTY